MTSVIIPALNEEDVIEKTIQGLVTVPGIEVIVADGGSTDKTVNLCKQLARVINSEPGRGRQMNAGAKEASGDILLFLHADTILPEGWKDKIAAAMSGETHMSHRLTKMDENRPHPHLNPLPEGEETILLPPLQGFMPGRVEGWGGDGVSSEQKVVGGAFTLSIDSARLSHKIIASAANIRSRVIGIHYGDQGIFVKRSAFEKIGGFKNIPIMEDVDLMRRLKKVGTVVMLKDKVATSARRWDKEGAVYATIRNWLLITLYYIGVAPERLYKFYKMAR